MASCFRPRGLAHYQDYRMKKIKVSVCEEHTQVVSSCHIREESNTVQEASPAASPVCRLQPGSSPKACRCQNTVLVWIDGAWSGRVALCKSTTAGAVRLRNLAIETPKVDRWETLDVVRYGTAGLARVLRLIERQTTWLQEAPRRRLSKRFQLLKRCQTRLTASAKRPSVRRRARSNFTELAECWNRRSRKKETCRRGDPSSRSWGCEEESLPGRYLRSRPQLRVKVLESEAKLSRVSKCRVVAVTSRVAVPSNTRAQRSCLGFICGLARTASASDEVIVNGYWFKRVSGTTTGMMEATGPTPHSRRMLGQEEQSRERGWFGVWP